MPALKGKEFRRDKFVAVRFNEREYATLVRAAKGRRSLADFIREALASAGVLSAKLTTRSTQ